MRKYFTFLKLRKSYKYKRLSHRNYKKNSIIPKYHKRLIKSMKNKIIFIN